MCTSVARAPTRNFDLIIMGLGVSDGIGYSVGTADEDVNGDGLADVIVGAHNNDAV